METERSKNLTMVLQGNNCSFGVLQSYEEQGDQFQANVKIEAGKLMTGNIYTIILQPYRLEYGTPPSAS